MAYPLKRSTAIFHLDFPLESNKKSRVVIDLTADTHPIVDLVDLTKSELAREESKLKMGAQEFVVGDENDSDNDSEIQSHYAFPPFIPPRQRVITTIPPSDISHSLLERFITTIFSWEEFAIFANKLSEIVDNIGHIEATHSEYGLLTLNFSASGTSNPEEPTKTENSFPNTSLLSRLMTAFPGHIISEEVSIQHQNTGPFRTFFLDISSHETDWQTCFNFLMILLATSHNLRMFSVISSSLGGGCRKYLIRFVLETSKVYPQLSNFISTLNIPEKEDLKRNDLSELIDRLYYTHPLHEDKLWDLIDTQKIE